MAKRKQVFAYNQLSIGSDNLQFYPNFALFSTLEGMNLDHDFVQVWKFSEDQKKNANRTLFLREFRWRPKKKKKVFSKNRTLFPQIYSQLYSTPIQIIGGDADVDHSQTIGGDTAKLLGGYIPHPPQVSAPLHTMKITWT